MITSKFDELFDRLNLKILSLDILNRLKAKKCQIFNSLCTPTIKTITTTTTKSESNFYVYRPRPTLLPLRSRRTVDDKSPKPGKSRTRLNGITGDNTEWVMISKFPATAVMRLYAALYWRRQRTRFVGFVRLPLFVSTFCRGVAPLWCCLGMPGALCGNGWFPGEWKSWFVNVKNEKVDSEDDLMKFQPRLRIRFRLQQRHDEYICISMWMTESCGYKTNI